MAEEIDIITIRSRKTDYPIMLTLVPENFDEIAKETTIDILTLEKKWCDADKKGQNVHFIFWKAAS